MSFPWLDCTPAPTHGAERRAKVAADEVASRAALFYRLGVPVATATRRLQARIAWEFEPAGNAHRRPESLSDAAIGKIVEATYARRPG